MSKTNRRRAIIESDEDDDEEQQFDSGNVKNESSVKQEFPIQEETDSNNSNIKKADQLKKNIKSDKKKIRIQDDHEENTPFSNQVYDENDDNDVKEPSVTVNDSNKNNNNKDNETLKQPRKVSNAVEKKKTTKRTEIKKELPSKPQYEGHECVARMNNVDSLIKIFSSVVDLVTDVNLDFMRDGIHCQAMDVSHVSLVLLKFSAADFVSYHYGRDVTTGLSIKSLIKALRLGKSTGPVVPVDMKVGSGSDVMNLRMGDEHRVNYELRLMDIDSESLSIPELQYEWEINLPSSKYEAFILLLKNDYGTVRFQVSEQQLVLKGGFESHEHKFDIAWKSSGPRALTADELADEALQGESDCDQEDDNDYSHSTKSKSKNIDESYDDDDDDEQLEVAFNGDRVKIKRNKQMKGKATKSTDENVYIKHNPIYGGASNTELRASFALKYLVLFGNARQAKSISQDDNRIILYLANDVPMKVKFPFMSQSFIEYFLAPKIDDDDEMRN